MASVVMSPRSNYSESYSVKFRSYQKYDYNRNEREKFSVRSSNNVEREEISAAAPINSSTIRQICLRCAAKNARNVRVNQGGEGTLVCRGLF